MKEIMRRSTAIALLVTVGGLASAPAQKLLDDTGSSGRKQKWEDPRLGTVCSGDCTSSNPDKMCCE